MLRNLSRILLVLGAAVLAVAPGLSAQTGGQPVRGDVDGDGRVTAADARIVADYLVGRAVPAGIDVAARGDVNGDGRVTAADAAIINAYAAGRENAKRFPVGTPVRTIPNAVAAVACTGDVRARTVSCQTPSVLPPGVKALIVGGQHQYVDVTSSNVALTVPSEAKEKFDFAFDVAVKNLMAQTLGTTDGITANAEGIKLFFASGPVVTSGVGSIEVTNATMGIVTASNQMYYQYPAPLPTGSTTPTQNWVFRFDSTVVTFGFTLYVSAHVQHEEGTVDVAARSDTVETGDTVTLVPTVRFANGSIDDSSKVVRWTGSDSTLATVDSVTGAVLGTNEGTVVFTAAAPASSQRSGTAHGTRSVVFRSPAPYSTITAVPATLPSGDTSTITVQLKNADGDNIHHPAGPVVLSTTGGTLSAVTNNLDGTYTAKLTSTVSGTFDVSGTLRGQPIGDTAHVTFGAAPLHHFLVEAAAGGNIPDQLVNTPFNVKVTAKDIYNNTVTTFTGSVNFTTKPVDGITAGAVSPAFTAGVLASHAITIGTTGNDTLVATRVGGAESGISNLFQVQAAPSAVNDGPTAASVPGDPYHTAFNTTFNLAAPGIMTNDTRGFPLATVVSFGADSLGGTVTSHPADGTPVSLPGHADGSITVNANGSVSFTPPTGFTGLYVFHYRIGNVRGTSDAQVTIAVGVRPAVVNDAYSTNLLGNVPINTATSTNFRVTTNDAGDAKVLAKTGESHGVATLNADGTFTFLPDAGYTGPASFTYTVTNGFGTTPAATVSMTVSGIAWFVNANAASNGDGRVGTPFKDLSSAFAAAVKPAANQPIFLYSSGTSYTGGVTLLAGQRVVGQGATGTDFATVMGVSWPLDAGAQPSIGGANPTLVSGLTLGSGNTLQGFSLGGSSTALTGNGFGTLTISQVGINTSGQALNLTNGTISGSFPQVRSTGGTNNVFLSNVATSSTVTLGTSADALSGSTADAFVISGGNGSFTYAGPITNTATLAVNVSGKTGGAVIFSGDINPSAAGKGISVTNNSSGTNTITFSGANQKISSGSAAGVNLTNNTGATISFAGAGTLSIATTTGNGFNATGGGTVAVNAGAGTNSITSAGGIALNVVNTTIGAGGLNFRSIGATGGSNGIVLNNTGSGALSVTGDGASDAANTTRGRTTAKSGGGTVALGSGGTLSSTTGTAVSLTSTGAVTLRNLVVQNGSGDGIAASTVSGLVLDNLQVTGKALGHGLHATSVSGLSILHSDFNSNATDASTAASDTWNVRLDDVSGTATAQSSLFRTGYEHIFVLKNTTATVNFSATNSNFTDAGHGDGLDIYAYGTSNVTATVQNDSLARNSSFGFDSGTQTGASGVLNVTLNNNQVINNFVGVDVAHGSAGTNTFSITNNNFQTNVASSSQAININRLADPTFTGFGLFSGTVSSNTIGTAGVANSGSDVGDGITVKTNGNGGTIRVSVLNNTIRSYGQHGIAISARDANTGHTLHARVQGNNIANGEAVTSLDGVSVTMGALNTDKITMCLDIGGTTAAQQNTVTSAVRNGVRVRSSGLPAANITLTAPSYDGTGATYFATRNPAATGATANTSFSNASGTTTAGSCTTP